MIDTDFIVWDNISGIFGQDGITTAHREELYHDVYPHPSAFKTGNLAKRHFGSTMIMPIYCRATRHSHIFTIMTSRNSMFGSQLTL